jgi:glycerophosphoryl diester phosphodiesterase
MRSSRRDHVWLSWAAISVWMAAGACNSGGDIDAATTTGPAADTSEGSTSDSPATGGAPSTDTGGDTTASDATGAADETPEDTLWADRVLNIAHAGGKGTRPEHTMLAYETALADGADVLELDVHATADGVLVLMHDETVDRTTDGTGAIMDLTYAELAALDAGYAFTTDGGATFPFRGMGLTVPTLPEVFDAHPDVAYVIELKQEEPSIVEPFLALCNDRGITDQMVASAFSDSLLAELRAAAPNVPTSFALAEVIAFMGLAPDGEATYDPPGEFLQVPISQSGITVLTAEFVDKAKRFDLKVHAWTINDPVQMQTVVDFGVDGIITDYPAQLRDILAAQ